MTYIPSFGGILKVQVSTVGDPTILIYNRDKTICRVFPQTESILKEMNGDLKKFFYYHLSPATKTIVLDGEAPWQQW